MMKNLLLGTALAMTASVASAEVLITGNNVQQLLDIIKDEGYSVRIDDSDPSDVNIVGKLNGSEYRVYFYGCDNPRGCDSIQFSTGYNLENGMTFESANAWNRGKRFAKLYLDDEMDPWLQMDVNLDGGVTRANVEDTMDYWRLLMTAFEDHIDW